MNVKETGFAGLLLIEPEIFRDERGFFLETYSESKYKKMGVDERFVQDNHSFSKKGTLRGLHFQINHPQGKLVRVVKGSVFDVVVDLRKSSPTYAEHFTIELNSEKLNQLYIPPGFAHGFCVISETAHFEYKCTDFYYPSDEGGIIWNDPMLDIHWPIREPSISQKDGLYPALTDIKESKLPHVDWHA